MATICLYQDTCHEKPLHWIRDCVGIGYVSRRKDGISELRINGYKQIKSILLELQPFIRFKATQTTALIQACDLLGSKPYQTMCDTDMKKILDLLFVIRKENYASRCTTSKEELYERLGLTP